MGSSASRKNTTFIYLTILKYRPHTWCTDMDFHRCVVGNVECLEVCVGNHKSAFIMFQYLTCLSKIHCSHDLVHKIKSLYTTSVNLPPLHRLSLVLRSSVNAVEILALHA